MNRVGVNRPYRKKHDMTQLAEMGAIIAPPMPAFYTRPANLADMVEHSLGRVLDLFDLDVPALPRWGDAV